MHVHQAPEMGSTSAVFNVQGDNTGALDVSLHFPQIKMVLWLVP